MRTKSLISHVVLTSWPPRGNRGVAQVVHFTTVSGLTGVLAAKAVKSRARLPTDKYLEHVYQPNSAIRKDRAWLDYVNLSISRINDWMFDSSTSWHVP